MPDPLPNDTSHEPQFRKRVLLMAAVGGFVGSGLPLLLWLLLCGCPCDSQPDPRAPEPTSSLPAAAN